MLTMLDYRSDRRISQHEMAIAANTSTATIKRLERQHIDNRIARLIEFADATLTDGPHTWIRPRVFYPVSMEPMPLTMRDKLEPNECYVQLGYVWGNLYHSAPVPPSLYQFREQHRHLRIFTLYRVERQRPRQVEIITMKPAHFTPVENYLVALKKETYDHDLQV